MICTLMQTLIEHHRYGRFWWGFMRDRFRGEAERQREEMEAAKAFVSCQPDPFEGCLLTKTLKRGLQDYQK